MKFTTTVHDTAYSVVQDHVKVRTNVQYTYIHVYNDKFRVLLYNIALTDMLRLHLNFVHLVLHTLTCIGGE